MDFNFHSLTEGKSHTMSVLKFNATQHNKSFTNSNTNSADNLSLSKPYYTTQTHSSPQKGYCGCDCSYPTVADNNSSYDLYRFEILKRLDNSSCWETCKTQPHSLNAEQVLLTKQVRNNGSLILPNVCIEPIISCTWRQKSFCSSTSTFSMEGCYIDLMS